MMLLTEKYSPKSIDQIIGNETAKERVKKWILDFSRGKIQKPLLIYGPTGTGKTSFAYALKEEFDLELIEMNASQFRDKGQVDRIMQNTLSAGTLTGKKKIILIDDVEILGRNDRGGAGEINKLIGEAKIPIILTATNAWDKKISSIRMSCELVQLRRITKSSIQKLLIQIAKLENLEILQEKIEEIAFNSNGDIRAAIMDLQAMHTHTRDNEKDIFNLVREIFKGEQYSKIKEMLRGDIDFNILKLWMDENIPNEYHDLKDIAKAYYYMARADQFEGRIRMSEWIYLKYVIDFSTIGVALSKSKRNNGFVKYNFPKYLAQMSVSAKKRAFLKSIGEKIGAKTHTNKKAALDYLPIICDQIKGNKKIGDYYGFGEEETEFLLKMPIKKIAEAKKVRKTAPKKEKTDGLSQFL
ncbi:MAG: replication factor C large subunit [Candidatus Micrarchaeia archaeon]